MKSESLGGVMITGAACGIGLAIAQELALGGYGVVIADLDDAAGARAATEIRAKGGRALNCAVDVSDRSSVAASVRACEDAFGFIHAIVNNAGICRPQPFLDTTDENWDRTIKINGLGVLIGMQEAAKAMIAAGRKGKIVNTASVASRSGDAEWVSYCASKAAVVSLTQAGAKALGKHGINVNAFAPGLVQTDLWARTDKDLMNLGVTSRPGEAMENFSKKIPLGRTSTPKDVVGTVAFLISPASDYMTGQCLMIDGGVIMQ
ncbi:SDR family NAD(P)-dependent oxidoreductase [Bradyrhizobium glycinis]|uniref:SDR family NAD(P)-dependent oxidoreductase n=1 Tax=Bradyrhizobium glycinis TaxID=2751812 RepID=UPI0018D9790E|nr:glucose 1-dehydrogenase [Bradyrhizobium glycinis]MBH5371596.1 glucose 1-dehydrogenase [Bradyrhizobium glycinis]